MSGKSEHSRLCPLPWRHRVDRAFELLRRMLGRADNWCCDCQLEPWNRRGHRR